MYIAALLKSFSWQQYCSNWISLLALNFIGLPFRYAWISRNRNYFKGFSIDEMLRILVHAVEDQRINAV